MLTHKIFQRMFKRESCEKFTIEWRLNFQDTVSVHRPGFYAQRFQDFMTKTVFKKIPSRKYHPNQPLLTNLTSMLALNKAHSWIYSCYPSLLPSSTSMISDDLKNTITFPVMDMRITRINQCAFSSRNFVYHKKKDLRNSVNQCFPILFSIKRGWQADEWTHVSRTNSELLFKWIKVFFMIYFYISSNQYFINGTSVHRSFENLSKSLQAKKLSMKFDLGVRVNLRIFLNPKL